MSSNNMAPARAQATLDFREEQRRSRLHRVRQDVESILRHPTTTLDPETRARVEHAVAVLITEIAILDRQSSPGDGAEFVALIAQTVGIGRGPAIGLWMDAAAEPMARFAADWKAHTERATHSSEVRHQHRQLFDPDAFGPLLNLTRPQIRAIFGTEKCSIRPIKSRPDRFDRDTSRRLNELADELGLPREYVKDRYAAEGEGCFERLRAEAAMKRARTEKRLGIKPRKRGRPTKRDSVDALVASTAKQLRKSRRTIYSRLAEARAACSDPKAHAAAADACGLTPAELHMAEIGTTESFARRFRYIDRNIVEEWYLATEGKPLKDSLRRQWMSRNQWFEMVCEAKAWKLIQDLHTYGRDAHDTQAKTISLAQRVTDDGTAGLLRAEPHDAEAEISEAARAQALADGPRA